MSDQTQTSEQLPAQQLTLQQFDQRVAVVSLAPGSDVPSWAEPGALLSVTATPTETSLICADSAVPSRSPAVRPLVAFCVEGPLDPESVGVLVRLLVPLAEEQIPSLVQSTFDTDWVLVPANRADDAVVAWRRAGHVVNQPEARPARPARKKK